MRYRFLAQAAFTLGLVFTPALMSEAQPAIPQKHSTDTLPEETVTVTAPRLVPNAVINNFIKSFAEPSPMIGQIARWKASICPITVGLQPGFNKFVTQRVREIAGMIGARVNTKGSCKANIEILFTQQPQSVLNEIRAKHSALLGYHDVSQAKRLATIDHPIQAWYATATEDYNGQVALDESDSYTGTKIGGVEFPFTPMEAIQNSHLTTGLRSEFANVVIVADSNKIVGYEIGSLADYISMLALSQTQTFDACQALPSITNLTAAGCDAKRNVTSITDSDIAYLRALYRVNPTNKLSPQQSDIASQMRKILGGNW